MSYISAVQECAENIQAMLSDHFTGIGAGISPEQYAFLQFVNNQAGTIGIKQTVNPTPGKVKTVNLLYRQPLLESDVDETSPTACTGGDDLGNRLETYTIDTASDWKTKTATYSLSDLHCIEESFADFFTRELARLIDGVDRAVSDKTADQLALLTGDWSNDTESAFTVTSDALNVDYKDSTNKYNLEEFYNIISAKQMTGFGSMSAYFGGEKIFGLARAAQSGCCAINGVEMGQMWGQYGIAFAYDRHVQASLGGQEYGVIVQPGATALLSFNEAGWKNGLPVWMNGANYTIFSVISPKTGTLMDVKVSDNCGAVTISVGACTKLVGLPTNLFQTSDNFREVKFVNKVKAV